MNIPNGEGGKLLTATLHQLYDLNFAQIFLLLMVIALILALGGKELLRTIKGIFKGHGDQTVVINEKAPEHSMCRFDPAACPAHQAEFERSQQNKNDISKLDGEVSAFKEKIFSKLDKIDSTVSDIKVTIARIHPRGN